jgi:hypothetical protein
MRKAVLIRVLVALAAGAAVLACACGGAVSGSTAAAVAASPSSPTSTASPLAVPTPAAPEVPKTFVNRFGFTVTYDRAALRLIMARDDASTDRFGITPDGSAYRAAAIGLTGLADRAASQPVSSNTDAGDVTVVGWRASRAVAKPTLAEMRAARYLGWHGRRTPMVSLINTADGTTQIEKATLAGLRGYCAIQKASDRTNVAYFLFAGKRLYTIKYQAKDAAREKLGPVLEAVAQSLRVRSH